MPGSAIETDDRRRKLLEIVLCSWNAAGRFCNDVLKMRAKLDLVSHLFEEGTVIALQETHDDCAASIALEQLYSNAFVFFKSGQTAALWGVLIAIRRSYDELFDRKVMDVLVPGRILAVEPRVVRSMW